MRAMKKILLSLAVVLASQIATGQTGYETLLRAVILTGRGEAMDAVALLPGTADINGDAALLTVRGDIYLKASMIRDARSDYMRAESLRQGAGLYGLAKCAAAEGDLKTAVTLLEAHLRSSMRRSEPQILLDNAFKSVSASSEWRALWKNDWYKVDERKSWEIDNYLKSGRNDLAEGVYAELVSIYPDKPLTEYCHARILMGSGRYREAADILTMVTQGSDTPAPWLYALAEAREGEGDHYAAAAVYDRLLSARTPDPGLLLKRHACSSDPETGTLQRRRCSDTFQLILTTRKHLV